MDHYEQNLAIAQPLDAWDKIFRERALESPDTYPKYADNKYTSFMVKGRRGEKNPTFYVEVICGSP